MKNETNLLSIIIWNLGGYIFLCINCGFLFRAQMVIKIMTTAISISITAYLCSGYCAEHFLLVSSFNPHIIIEDMCYYYSHSTKGSEVQRS